MLNCNPFFCLVSSCCIAVTATLGAQSSPSFELKRDTYSSYASTIVQGDFDRDGKPDLILGGGSSHASLALRRGNGDGTFQAPKTVGTVHPSGVLALYAYDVNDDGKLDVVAVDLDGFVDIFIGAGDGTFEQAAPIATYSTPTAVVAGDFNGDGLADLAVGDENGGVEIFLNVGGKNFSYHKTYPLPDSGGLGVTALAIGDEDGNGVYDVGALTGSSAYVLYGDNHANFKTTLLSNYTSTQGITFGDVNQDGRPDLLVAYNCGAESPYGSPDPWEPCLGVDTFYTNTAHTLKASHSVIAHGVEASRAWPVDVDGDGIVDLVAATGDTVDTRWGLFVWMGHADGSFDSSPKRFIATIEGGGEVVLGDWNRDGMMDFAQPIGSLGQTGVYLNASVRPACATSSIKRTLTECQPVESTYARSPIKLQANAFDTTPVARVEQYVDGSKVYTATSSRLNVTLPLTAGVHLLTTRAFDASGSSFETARTVTVANTAAAVTCSAALGTANLCMPATSPKGVPVHIVGNGYSATVPVASQLYLDGKLVLNEKVCSSYCTGGVSAIDTMQTLASGSHRVTFKLWDMDGNVYATSRTVTIE